jgi:hypothetical protein
MMVCTIGIWKEKYDQLLTIENARSEKGDLFYPEFMNQMI